MWLVLRRLAFLPLPRHFSRCGANLVNDISSEDNRGQANIQVYVKAKVVAPAWTIASFTERKAGKYLYCSSCQPVQAYYLDAAMRLPQCTHVTSSRGCCVSTCPKTSTRTPLPALPCICCREGSATCRYAPCYCSANHT